MVVSKSGKYQFSNGKYDPAATQKFVCGKSGVTGTFEKATDDDIAKMIASGNKDWTAVPDYKWGAKTA